MHGASRIAMPFVRYGGHNHTTFGNFNDIVIQRLSH